MLHLVKDERRSGYRARQLGLSFRWLLARARLGPASALLADVARLCGHLAASAVGGGRGGRASTVVGHDTEIHAADLIQSMLRLSQGSLARGGWTHLAGQIVGRLMGYAEEEDGGQEGFKKEKIAELVREAKAWAGAWVPMEKGKDGAALAGTTQGVWCPVSRTMEPAGGPCIALWTGHSKGVNSLDLNADGTRLVSGSDDCTLRIWETATGQSLKVLKGHAKGVNSVAWSKDGGKIVSASEDMSVRVWEAETGECVKVMTGHSGRVLCCAVSADGKFAVSGGVDKTLRVWDLEKESSSGQTSATEEEKKKTKGVGAGSILALKKAASGTSSKGAFGMPGSKQDMYAKAEGFRLAAAALPAPVVVDSGECVKVLEGHSSYVSCCSMSRNGQKIVSGGWDKKLILWEEGGAGKVLNEDDGNKPKITSVKWSHDEEKILCAYKIGETEDLTGKDLAVWDASTGKRDLILGPHLGASAAAWSRDGEVVVSGSERNRWNNSGPAVVKVWNVWDSECIMEAEGHQDSITSVAVHGDEDARTIFSASDDSNIRVWKSNALPCVDVVKGHGTRAEAVAVSRDGSAVVSTSKDGIRVWDPETGECTKFIKGPDRGNLKDYELGGVVAVSDDGSRIVAGAHSRLDMWDAEGVFTTEMTGHEHQINCLDVVWSDSVKRFVSGGSLLVCVWCGETGERINLLKGHKAGVYAVAMSADGKRVVSGSKDETVRVWDVETGKCLNVLEGHGMQGTVISVWVSRDGKLVASKVNDGKVRVWNADTGACLYEGTEIEGFGDEQTILDCRTRGFAAGPPKFYNRPGQDEWQRSGDGSVMACIDGKSVVIVRNAQA
jgi:WD40 repeat protein